MKKTTLALMEQTAMVLVFALAAALCLRAFVLADIRSQENARCDTAVLYAQTAAETLKSHSGDFAAAAEDLAGLWDGKTLSVSYDDIQLRIYPQSSGLPLLGQAEIEVLSAEQLLTQLTVNWQEAKNNEV